MKKLIALFLCLCLMAGIAPVIAEESNTAFTDKAVPVIRENLESTETAVLRCYEDLPDIPYMNVVDFYNQFYLVGTDLAEGMTCTQSGDVYTLKNIAGRVAQFDIGADTISTDNLEGFALTAHTLQAEMAGIPDSNYPFVLITYTYDPDTTEPKTLNLAEYGIDLRGDDSGVYAPVATLCDLFAFTSYSPARSFIPVITWRHSRANPRWRTIPTLPKR